MSVKSHLSTKRWSNKALIASLAALAAATPEMAVAACQPGLGFDEPPPSPTRETAWLDISTAPHAQRSPCRATGAPSTIMVGSPVTMTVVPWPFFGQVTWSPTRANRFPWVSVVCVDPMTTPPWLVWSPITMNGLIASPVIFLGESSRPDHRLNVSPSNKALPNYLHFVVLWLVHRSGAPTTS